ncbi:MAG: T9SS type A sorting domain-containing protein [Bacteroidales bacterium]|nr:T9SS type A sorting domain-containing protein [Bacteroidales bacterium]
MKKALFLFILIITSSLSQACFGQDHFTILESDNNHVSLHFDLGDFSIDTILYNGEIMHTVTTKGIMVPNEFGQPDLPTFNRFVAIPQGANAVVEVKMSRDELMSGVNIAPSIGSQCENEAERVLCKDSLIYSTNRFFPLESVRTDAPQTWRGVDVIHLGLCPVQFNPVTKEIAIHRQMDIEIRFEGGNGHFGDDRLRSPYWDPILRNNLLNYDRLSTIDYDARMQQWSQTRSTGCEYLIMTPDDDAYYEAAQELADYRLRQGILTKVMRVTETGATDAITLRLWFHEIYQSWDIPPAAVCIIGESGSDLQSFVPGFTTPHPKDGTITSDNPFADVNGDYLPDICFTRLIAQNESELPIFIGKQIEYEYTKPVTNPNYYARPLTAAGWQNSMWFQICIATISGYLAQHGKMPYRINEIYSGNPGLDWSTAPGTNAVVSYFGPDGVGYIPASPAELGGWTGGTASDVINAINTGTYLIQHRDHGWNNKWYQPEIYVSDFGAINNEMMSYLISVNCRTGMYDENTTCFTEALMRMTRDGHNAGVVGAISPAGQTYSFANDIYLWGVWDLFYPSFLPEYGPFADHSDSWMPAFANVSGKYFLATNVFPSTNEEMLSTTCISYHTHGDAFLRIFTEVPQAIDMECDANISCFNPFHITATKGVQIALTSVVNGETRILATATATGQEQTLTINEIVSLGHVHLTLTGQNRLRHEEDIPLVPIDGPFVVTESVNANDVGLALSYDQPVQARIVVSNVGNSASSGGMVNLTCESEHVSVTQGQAQFHFLQPGASQIIEDAFHFELDDAIADGSIIPITVTTHFGDESYPSVFDLQILSPNITANLIEIDDGSGNGNGLLDPGEFATLVFRVANSGHFLATQPKISLNHNEGYVRVITEEQTLEDLGIGESTEVSFEVYVEYLAGEVPQVNLTLQSVVKNLRINQDISCTIGLAVESFEQGVLNPEYWTNDSMHPWRTVSDYVYDGDYSIKSAVIDHDESSSLTFTYMAYEEGTISFYSMVSSEPNYDFLIFSIDNMEEGNWSGEEVWAEHSYNVDPGLHTFVWTYSKDYSVDGGLDAAWVDYIHLPFHPDETAEQMDLPLTLQPNPTTGQVGVVLEVEEEFMVRVYDEFGRLVLSEQNDKVFSLKGMPSGIYHVVVIQNGHRWSRKIVKI